MDGSDGLHNVHVLTNANKLYTERRLNSKSCVYFITIKNFLLSPIRILNIGQLNGGLVNSLVAYFVKDPGSFHLHIWTKDSYGFGTKVLTPREKKIQISGEGKRKHCGSELKPAEQYKPVFYKFHHKLF